MATEAGLPFSTARELFGAFPTAGEDMRARPAGETALGFLSVLRQSATPEDAITYGAYLLPRRLAVLWGHQCVKRYADLLVPGDLQLLALAEAWLSEPEEAQRWSALRAGLAAPDKTPGAWICLAVGWSGGSMAAPDVPRVPPPPFLTPRAVNVAVLSALARVPLPQRAAALNGFVDACIGVANR